MDRDRINFVQDIYSGNVDSAIRVSKDKSKCRNIVLGMKKNLPVALLIW